VFFWHVGRDGDIARLELCDVRNLELESEKETF
jgi:hypothetical protein